MAFETADDDVGTTAERMVEGVAEDLDELRRRLAEADARQAELTDRLLRLQAEFENYRRRTRQEMQQSSDSAGEAIFRQLLPIVDNLERAVAAGPDASEPAGSRTDSAVAEGVRLVLRQLLDLLEKNGVTPIESLNQPFDPHVHEAVIRVEEQGYETDTVVEEFQRGYSLQGKILRPSMVKVAVAGG